MQMSNCDGLGQPAVSAADFFKPAIVGAAASLSGSKRTTSSSPQQVVTQLQPLVQNKDGFLKTIEFEVAEVRGSFPGFIQHYFVSFALSIYFIFVPSPKPHWSSVGVIEEHQRCVDVSLQPSFILAEVGFNFMVSHVEMDLITANTVRFVIRGSDVFSFMPFHDYHYCIFRIVLPQDHTVALGELDFLHSTDHPINARQWIATHLDPYCQP